MFNWSVQCYHSGTIVFNPSTLSEYNYRWRLCSLVSFNTGNLTAMEKHGIHVLLEYVYNYAVFSLDDVVVQLFQNCITELLKNCRLAT